MSEQGFGCGTFLVVLAIAGYFGYEHIQKNEKAKQERTALHSQFAQVIADDARKLGLPRMLDPGTRLDSVRAEGLSVISSYTMFDPEKSGSENNPYISESMKDRERSDRNRYIARLMTKELLPQITQRDCSTSAELLKAGGRKIYRYEDHRALPIVEFTVSKDDCGL